MQTPFRTNNAPTIAGYGNHVSEPLSSPRPQALTVPIGPIVNFASDFRIEVKAAERFHVYATVLDWVRGHFPDGKFPVSLESFLKTTKIANPDFQIRCRTESVTAQDPRDVPKHWLMELSHPEKHFKSRTWQTRVGVNVVDESNLQMSVTNEHSLAPNFLGNVTMPSFSTPRLVRALVSNKNFKVLSGDTQLSEVPKPVGHHELPQLVSAILDPIRTLPVVVLSPNWSEDDSHPRYPLDPNRVGRGLCGIAATYALSSNDIYQGLGYLSVSLQNSQLPHRGWVFVYFPVSPGGEVKPFKLSADRLLEDPVKGLIDIQTLALRHVLSHRESDIGSVSAVRTVADMESIRRSMLLEELRAMTAAADAGPSKAAALTDGERQLQEYVKVAEEIIAEQNLALRELRKQLESATTNLRDAQAETLSQRQRAESYLALLREQSPDKHSKPSTKPEDLRSALKYVEEHFSERIIVLQQAYDGANKMVDDECLRKPAKMKRAIALIVEALPHLWALKFEQQSLDEQTFRDKTGLTLSFGEGSKVSNDTELRRYRSATYQGTERYVPAHVKYGNSPKEQLRVHFFFDESTRRLVVTHVVDHLPTGSSRMDGKRSS
jgi:hypothetical protein